MNRRIIAAVISAGLMITGFAGCTAGANTANTAGSTQTIDTKGQTGTNSGTVASANSTITNTSAGSEGKVLNIEEIAKMNENSVVEIRTEGAVTDRIFGQFIAEGAGSGVIMTNDGYIVTNNHVVDKATKIIVVLKDGTSYDGTLKGTDSVTDLAVIKIDAMNLIPATPGDSDSLVVGELAVAIGNPLGELGGTVTEGIISALDREINIEGRVMNLLQTSAAINPGNSGGGLFDKYGKLVGIVNAKSSGSNIEGLGFAIPINTATKVVSDITTYGYVKGRKSLGISIVDISTEQLAAMYRVEKTGVYIKNTTKDNGFKAGDRIVSMNGTEITKASQVKEIMGKLKVGDKVETTVDRDGENKVISILLEEDKN